MKKLLMVSAVGLTMLSIPAIAGHHEGGDHKKGAKVEEMFKSADADSNGAISKDEYMAHVQKKAAEKFAEKDANNDGSVSMDEAKAYKEKKRDMMKEKRGEMKKKMMERSSGN